MGSSHKTRRRQVTRTLSILVTSGSTTPVTTPDAQATAMMPTQVETIQTESAPEPLAPVPIVGTPMQQPHMDSKLGGSYITTTQAQNTGNVSLCSLDLVAHEYLKHHFNERLNDKVYGTFKELFNNINTDSIKEALPKVSVYITIIAKHVKEINLKYGIELSYTQLEATEIGHWAKSFQVATSGKVQPKQQQPQQLPKLQHPQEAQET